MTAAIDPLRVFLKVEFEVLVLVVIKWFRCLEGDELKADKPKRKSD